MPPHVHAPTAEELLEHAGFLRRLASELSGSSDAPDVVQDAFTLALERPPRRGTLRAWLAVVVANLARNVRRGRERRGQRERRYASSEAREPDQLALERLEVQNRLVELVLKLPPEQRTVLHLRFFEAESPRAIARRLGVPLKTVMSRQTRGLAALRAALDARSGGDRREWLGALAPFAFPKSGAAVSTAIAGVWIMKKAIGLALLALLLFFVMRGVAPLLRERPRHAMSPLGAEVPPATAPAPLAPVLSPNSMAGREPALDVTPPATGGLRLAFRHSDGTPAADAPLAIECRTDPAPRVEVWRTRTDEEGRAELAQLFAGEVWLWLMDQRFDVEVVAGEVRAFEFELEAGYEVVGTVVDTHGAPLTGAEIWGGRSSARQPGGYRLGRSDSAGRFRLRDVDAFAPLCARKRGFVASIAEQALDLPGDGSGARVAKFVLEERGGDLRGLVLDPNGQPLRGALVLAGPEGNWTIPERSGITPEIAFAETDASGVFELDCALPSGTHPIHATARGFPVWRGEVEIVTGKATRLEIQLERPGRIEGQVLGLDGVPVAGVRVIASEEERGGWYHDRFGASEAVTDSSGWFVLEGLAPGMRELNASDPDRPELGRARASVVCTGEPTSTCELRLELGHTIAGRVVDGRGAPLAGWSVHGQASFFSQWYPRQAKTDAEGRFLLANLGAGEHELTVRAPGLSFPRARRADVPVDSSAVELVVEEGELRPGRVRGRIVPPGGARPGDFTVTLWLEDAREGHFLALDASGVFEFEAEPGRYSVCVKAGGADILTSAVMTLDEDGDADFGDLVLTGGGWLELEVAVPPAVPLERLRFRLDRPGAYSVSLTWRDGFLCSPEVMPGRWRITWNEEELEARDTEVLIVSGEATRAKLALELR